MARDLLLRLSEDGEEAVASALPVGSRRRARAGRATTSRSASWCGGSRDRRRPPRGLPRPGPRAPGRRRRPASLRGPARRPVRGAVAARGGPALGAAVQEGVPGTLRNGRGPFAALAAPLAARSWTSAASTAALARWAVDSWGIALGLTAEAVVGGVRVVSEPPGAAVEASTDGRSGPRPSSCPT